MNEELGTCTYCGRTGKAKNLRKLPDDKYPREYCPKCYPSVLGEHNKERNEYLRQREQIERWKKGMKDPGGKPGT
ncbi:hypothetical protein [Pseudalkalibacillus caeni]|uniref:Uncharacterized protein n=1 Tax=Exobacillus caeni TaxID=2574798 RepID=A0A5R9FB09_9BACL|nr:hypothetical protein [Pseudalkalibacillus caeni]TLS37724.1 hypothetical protein FCL54_07835 [Pseudalkalibacillus caeni]